MATKKKNKDVQPKAEVKGGSQEPKVKAEELKAPKSGVVTSEGNVIDKIRIFQKDDGTTMVQADYGKLNPEGKNAEERRAGMHTLISHELSPEQAKEYQRLYAKDPVKAKEYAVRAAYPMHVDDAAFHLRDTTVNGRHVNYIVLEKLTEDKLSENNKHLAGKWQLSFGEKDNKDSRFYGILNREELASIRHRAEVTLGEHGEVKSIGAPLSMADIAARVEQRVVAQRQEKEAKLAGAEKVDWSKFKLPEGATVTGLRYAPVKDNPDRVWLNGKVNGIEVFGLLSKNETTALKNKMATLEQVAAANKEFRDKVKAIVAPAEAKAVTEDAAVKVIIARASDATAKSLTAEQRDTLMTFAANAATPEDREKLFDGLWGKAETALKDAGVNEVWQKDAHIELKDLAHGVVRDEQQGLKR